MKPKIFTIYGMWVCDSGHFNPTCHSTPIDAYNGWFDKAMDVMPAQLADYVCDIVAADMKSSGVMV